MNQLIPLLNRISNWKTFTFFLALFVFFNAFVLKNAEKKLMDLAGKPVKIIDLTIGFNPKKTLKHIESYGDAGREYYGQIESTTDLIYPIIYAFLFGILLTLWFRKSRFPWVTVVPFIVLLLDYGENTCILTLLKFYPEQSMVAATLCEVFKALKWLAFGSIILMVIYGLFTKVLMRSKEVKNEDV